jgi:hypothetical protein
VFSHALRPVIDRWSDSFSNAPTDRTKHTVGRADRIMDTTSSTYPGNDGGKDEAVLRLPGAGVPVECSKPPAIVYVFRPQLLARPLRLPGAKPGWTSQDLSPPGWAGPVLCDRRRTDIPTPAGCLPRFDRGRADGNAEGR